MVDITAKVDDEKLLSLYNPFDTQINKAMNNAVSRRFQKKCLQDLVLAYNIVASERQGVTMYMKNVYRRCGMVLSQLQESFCTKRISKGKENEAKNTCSKKSKTRNQRRLVTELVWR